MCLLCRISCARPTLKDWGKRKNAYLAARSNVETAERTEQETARQNQIASLQNYWLAYYHLRRLTLYDYQRSQRVTR